MKQNLFFLFILSTIVLLTQNVVQASDTDTSLIAYDQKYDWLKLDTNEWIKGDIISMYDKTLEFDSVKLKVQYIDWEDVLELRSKDKVSILMLDETVAEGHLIVKNGQLSLVNDGIATEFDLHELLSIVASGEREIDLWTGYVNIGGNFRRGNTVQFDYTIGVGMQRRGLSNHLKADYTANYSKSKDKETDLESVTANSARLTTTYDWFFSQKIFFRSMDFEYFSDEFLNIDFRVSYGIALGYHLIDDSNSTWNVSAGPSYQKTRFEKVSAGENKSETSPGLALGTDFSYDITSDIAFDTSYQVTFVNEASGQYLQHFETGVDIDLSNDFDLDLNFYFDKTAKPHPDENGLMPKKNDYRFVVSIRYDF